MAENMMQEAKNECLMPTKHTETHIQTYTHTRTHTCQLYAYKLSTEEMETGGSLGLAGQPA